MHEASYKSHTAPYPQKQITPGSTIVRYRPYEGTYAQSYVTVSSPTAKILRAFTAPAKWTKKAANSVIC